MLSNIRPALKSVPPRRRLAASAALAAAGLASGAAIKLLDIYTTNLGNIFSQLSVWILICTVISVYSASPKRAAVNVFVFCAGMLAAYYASAELLGSVYSLTFVYGWAVFSLFSPVLAYITWYAKGKHAVSRLLSAAVILVMLAAAVVLFDRIRVSDIVIAALTAAVLFT